MSGISVELQLGEIIGQNKMILRELDLATERSSELTRNIDDVKATATNTYVTTEKLDVRVAVVEEVLLTYKPTIEEFLDIKQKVIGAGKLGKWLWGVLAALIGVTFAIRTELFSWFAK